MVWCQMPDYVRKTIQGLNKFKLTSYSHSHILTCHIDECVFYDEEIVDFVDDFKLFM